MHPFLTTSQARAGYGPQVPPVPGTVRSYGVLNNVYQLLGLSTIYTEHRGNIDSALKVAEDELRKARASGDPLYLAAALLASGICLVLQGSCSAAMQNLDEAVHLSAQAPALQLHALIYLYLAQCIRYNFFPDNGPGAVNDISHRFNSVKNLQSWESRKQHLLPAIVKDDLLLSEESLLRKWAMSQSHRRKESGQRDAPSLKSLDILISGYQKDCRELQNANAHPCQIACLQLAIADSLFKHQKYEESKLTLESARALYAQIDDRIGIGNCEMKLGDWLVAPVSTPAVWNSFLHESTSDDALHWMTEHAEGISHLSKAKDAHLHYHNAAGYFQAENATRGVAAIELRLAYLLVMEGLSGFEFESWFTQAKERIANAAKLFLDVGDIMAYQLCLAQIALCAIGEGRSPADIGTAITIGNWGRTDGSFGFALGIGLFFARLGRRWLVHIGDHERALACFRLSTALFKELGAGLSHSHTIMDQMIVYELLGDNPTFSRLAEDNLKICKDLEEANQEQREDILTQSNWISIRILGSASKRSMPNLVRKVSAQFMSQMAESGEANLEGTVNALELVDSITRRLAETELSDDLETMLQNLNAIQLPSPLLTTQLFLKSQLADAEMFQLLYTGKEYYKTGNDKEARACFAEVRAKTTEISGSHRYLLEALAFAYEGITSEAIKSYSQCASEELQNVERQVAAGAATFLQDDQRRQIGIRALSFFCEAKAYEEARNWVVFLEDWPEWWKSEVQQWQGFRRIAEVQEGVGELEAAFATYEKAMTSFEDQRRLLSIDELKVAFASDSSAQSIYFGAVRVALKQRQLAQGEPHTKEAFEAKALQAIERGKARSLLDLMAGGVASKGEGSTTNKVLLRWRRQNAYLATRNGLLERELTEDKPDQSKIATLREMIANVQVQIQDSERELSDMQQLLRRAPTNVTDLATIAGKLLPDTLILQYVLNYEKLFIWAISDKGMVQVHEKRFKEYLLDRQAKKFRSDCENGIPATALGRWLAEELIQPFEKLLANYPRVLIVPSGSLHLLPFHTLPWKNTLLSVKHTISYLPSSSMLEYLTKKSTSDTVSEVLAIGNPSNMSVGRPLPGAAIEAKAIAQLIPGSKELLGSEATLDNVLGQVQNYKTLHFATHCILSADVPLLSSIILADGKDLTVYDLLDQQLDVDLVVLSACQTGRGDATAGDDVVGFSRALLAAGARAILVSLWPVDDAATSLMLINFYERLKSGEPLAKALQSAQAYLRGCSQRDNSLTRALEDLASELTDLKVPQEHIDKIRGTYQDDKDREDACREDIERDPARATVGLAKRRDYSLPKFWAPFVLISA